MPQRNDKRKKDQIQIPKPNNAIQNTIRIVWIEFEYFFKKCNEDQSWPPLNTKNVKIFILRKANVTKSSASLFCPHYLNSSNSIWKLDNELILKLNTTIWSKLLKYSNNSNNSHAHWLFLKVTIIFNLIYGNGNYRIYSMSIVVCISTAQGNVNSWS